MFEKNCITFIKLYIIVQKDYFKTCVNKITQTTAYIKNFLNIEEINKCIT